MINHVLAVIKDSIYNEIGNNYKIDIKTVLANILIF